MSLHMPSSKGTTTEPSFSEDLFVMMSFGEFAEALAWRQQHLPLKTSQNIVLSFGTAEGVVVLDSLTSALDRHKIEMPLILIFSGERHAGTRVRRLSGAPCSPLHPFVGEEAQPNTKTFGDVMDFYKRFPWEFRGNYFCQNRTPLIFVPEGDGIYRGVKSLRQVW